MKRLRTLERTLADEERADVERVFVDAPRLLRATGPVPPGRLLVDDRRSAGPWLVLADGTGILDAASGLEHAAQERARAYGEGTADLTGSAARRPPRPAPAREPASETRADAGARGVWLPPDGAPRIHGGFDDRARALLAGDDRSARRGANEAETRVRPVGPDDDGERILERILSLEAEVYEPARRDPPAKLRRAFDDPDGIAVLAERKVDGEWALVGFSLGVPLERVAGVDGVREDPGFGKNDTLYALTTTLSPAARGLGLGLAVKQASVRAAGARRTASGEPRYRWISGRNRVGATAAMMRINRRLGADVIDELQGQYGGDGVAAYYRLPVGAPIPGEAPERAPGPIDLSETRRLLRQPPESYLALRRGGGLYGPWMSPVEPDERWTTPAIERTRRAFAAIDSELPHVAFGRRYADLREQATRVAGRLRRPAEARDGLSDETRTAGWRGDPERFFLARRPRAVFWAVCPGLVALHAREPVTDTGGDALTLVRARHDLFALAGRTRRHSPLEPIFRELGFEGGGRVGRGRFFTRSMPSEMSAMDVQAAARELGVALGVSRETVFAALPWDLDDGERATIEEVLGSVLR